MRKVSELGQMIWRQSRDIAVLNYSHFFVYEIFTNQGFLRICVDKTTNTISLLDSTPSIVPSYLVENHEKKELK